ncbi:hypothetical protein LIPSTDRAFT_103144 [Lipomyces starkeyi NRRL Y-11557]|uniref:Uncharacterized protein n=1 Tax=Lipomyces starkeyi NRRL Y-11557 TaxID=675824 RepID=A0A1E3QBM7_LIPST|nr:hypothetical protein LIPSTDRAFT_103144 [Lipomyces starkeyi NRRL Y-11557]
MSNAVGHSHTEKKALRCNHTIHDFLLSILIYAIKYMMNGTGLINMVVTKYSRKL